MENKTKVLLFILLVPPLLGELLSGSTHFLEWTSPFVWVVLVSFYGGGTLLIREARARWKLQWTVILLGIAYGILEEGIMMQSFFNHNHADLSLMMNYAAFFGVQWTWTIMLIIFHATISTLIPIKMSELLWPREKDKPLIGKRGLAATMAVVLAITVLFMNMVWWQQPGMEVPYVPDPLTLGITSLITLGLVYAAYRYRNSKISSDGFLLPSLMFAIVGFLIQFLNILIGYLLPVNNVPGETAVLLHLGWIALLVLFGKYQILNRKARDKHMAYFLFGSVLAFSTIYALILEFDIKIFGALFVGFVTTILLIVWLRKVTK